MIYVALLLAASGHTIVRCPFSLHLQARVLEHRAGMSELSFAAPADPYFSGLSQPGREPSAQPVSKLSFEFERRKLTTDEV